MKRRLALFFLVVVFMASLVTPVRANSVLYMDGSFQGGLQVEVIFDSLMLVGQSRGDGDILEFNNQVVDDLRYYQRQNPDLNLSRSSVTMSGDRQIIGTYVFEFHSLDELSALLSKYSDSTVTLSAVQVESALFEAYRIEGLPESARSFVDGMMKPVREAQIFGALTDRALNAVNVYVSFVDASVVDGQINPRQTTLNYVQWGDSVVYGDSALVGLEINPVLHADQTVDVTYRYKFDGSKTIDTASISVFLKLQILNRFPEEQMAIEVSRQNNQQWIDFTVKKLDLSDINAVSMAMMGVQFSFEKVNGYDYYYQSLTESERRVLKAQMEKIGLSYPSEQQSRSMIILKSYFSVQGDSDLMYIINKKNQVDASFVAPMSIHYTFEDFDIYSINNKKVIGPNSMVDNISVSGNVVNVPYDNTYDNVLILKAQENVLTWVWPVLAIAGLVVAVLFVVRRGRTKHSSISDSKPVHVERPRLSAVLEQIQTSFTHAELYLRTLLIIGCALVFSLLMLVIARWFGLERLQNRIGLIGPSLLDPVVQLYQTLAFPFEQHIQYNASSYSQTSSVYINAGNTVINVIGLIGSFFSAKLILNLWHQWRKKPMKPVFNQWIDWMMSAFLIILAGIILHYLPYSTATLEQDYRVAFPIDLGKLLTMTVLLYSFLSFVLSYGLQFNRLYPRLFSLGYRYLLDRLLVVLVLSSGVGIVCAVVLNIPLALLYGVQILMLLIGLSFGATADLSLLPYLQPSLQQETSRVSFGLLGSIHPWWLALLMIAVPIVLLIGIPAFYKQIKQISKIRFALIFAGVFNVLLYGANEMLGLSILGIANLKLELSAFPITLLISFLWVWLILWLQRFPLVERTSTLFSSTLTWHRLQIPYMEPIFVPEKTEALLASAEGSDEPESFDGGITLSYSDESYGIQPEKTDPVPQPPEPLMDKNPVPDDFDGHYKEEDDGDA